MKKYVLIVVLLLGFFALQMSHVAFGQEAVRLGRYTIKPDVVKTRGQRVVSGGPYSGSFLIWFDGRLTAEAVSMLERSGLRLEGSAGGNAFFAYSHEGYVPAEVGGVRPVAIKPLEWRWKVDDALVDWRIPSHAKVGEHAEVVLSYFSSIAHTEVLAQLRDLGYSTAAGDAWQRALRLQIPRGAVQQLASLDWVATLRVAPMPQELHNNSGRTLSGASYLSHPSLMGGRGLSGRGVKIGVWDGTAERHMDYVSRLVQVETEITDLEATGHGTHVVGTMAGAGLLDPDAIGMAPRAQIFTHNFGNESNGFIPPVEMFETREKYGITITQNSYGVLLSRICDQYDEWAYDASGTDFATDLLVNYFPDLTHVYAAGNDQGSCGKMYGSFIKRAKNAIYVAAVDEMGDFSTFSSMGPTDDGRIQPTVAAKGVQVRSTYLDNGYGVLDGTSMACPVTSGTIALLTERYMQLHAGATPDAAFVRALVANSADEVEAPGPDYRYGYGILDGEEALQAIENHQWVRGQLPMGGGEETYTVRVPQGATRVRVALAWTDTVVRKVYAYGDPCLINDLDLTVISKGQEVLPWVLDAKNPEAPATRGVNSVDNLEQVAIEMPTGGEELTIKVRSDRVGSRGGQRYVVTWHFDYPVARFAYPLGGECFTPGEELIVRMAGPAKEGRLEFSHDGGQSYSVVGEVRNGQGRIAIPLDAPFTGTAKLRFSNAEGSGVLESIAFAVAAAPQGVHMAQSEGLRILAWEPLPWAEGYEVLVADEATDVEYRLLGTAQNASFKLPEDLCEGGKRIVLAVRAKGPNGLLSKRSLGVLVDEQALSPEWRIPADFQELFATDPVRYARIDLGAHLYGSLVPTHPLFGLEKGARSLSVAVSNDNDDPTWKDDDVFATTSRKGTVWLRGLDLTEETESTYIAVEGLGGGEAYDKSVTALRLRVGDEIVPLTSGKDFYSTSKYTFFILVWDMSKYNGKQIDVALEFALQDYDAKMLLCRLYGTRAVHDGSINVLETTLGTQAGQFTSEEAATVWLRNKSTDVAENVDVWVSADGKVLGHARLDKLQPFDEVAVPLTLDLSTQKQEGEVFPLVASVRMGAKVYHGGDTLLVSNTGRYVPMPHTVKGAYQSEAVDGEGVYYTDWCGQFFDYQTTQGKDIYDKLILTPSTKGKVVELTVLSCSLDPENLDSLNVYTYGGLYARRTVPTRSYKGASPLEAGETFVSLSADGSISVTHDGSRTARGEGFIFYAREVDPINTLRIEEVKVKPDLQKGESEVCVKLSNVGTLAVTDAKVGLRSGLESRDWRYYKLEELPRLEGGESVEYTYKQRIKAKAVPSVDSIEVRVYGYDGEGEDNVRRVRVVYDRYAVSPQKDAEDGNSIARLALYGENFNAGNAHPYENVLERDTITLYGRSENNALRVEFERMPEGMSLGMYIDWNNDGEFGDTNSGESVVMAVPDGSWDCPLTIAVPQGAEPGNKRMRVVYAPEAEMASHYRDGALSRGEAHDWVLRYVDKPYPHAGDLALLAVRTTHTGLHLTATNAVTIEVQNNGDKAIQEVEVFSRLDNGAIESETVALALDPYGARGEATLARNFDFSGKGLHVVDVWLALDENVHNDSASVLLSNVQPVEDGRDYYLSLSDGETIQLKDIETWKFKGFDLWLRMDAPQQGALISADGFLVLTLGEQKSMQENSLLIALDGGKEMYLLQDNIFTYGKWQHIAIYYRGGFGPTPLKAWVNGQEVMVLKIGDGATASYRGLRVGVKLQCDIDNFRIWKGEMDTDLVRTAMYGTAEESGLKNKLYAEFPCNEGPGNEGIFYQGDNSDEDYYGVILTSSGTGGGELWRHERPLVYSMAVEGALDPVQQNAKGQWVVKLPTGADCSVSRVTLESTYPGVRFLYNGVASLREHTIDLSSGEAVVYATLQGFWGKDYVDTLRIVVEEEFLSQEALLTAVTVEKAKNEGLMEDVNFTTSVPQTIDIPVEKAFSGGDVEVVFTASAGATVRLNGQAVSSPLRLNLGEPRMLEVVSESGRVTQWYSFSATRPTGSVGASQLVELVYGDSHTLTAATADGLPIVWYSGDNGVATVVKGQLQASGVGETVVRGEVRVDGSQGRAVVAEELRTVVVPRQVTGKPVRQVVPYGTHPREIEMQYAHLLRPGELAGAPIPTYTSDTWKDLRSLPGKGTHKLVPVKKESYRAGNYLITPEEGELEVVSSGAQQVVFTVVDGSGHPVKDATVRVGTNEGQTDGAGELEFVLHPEVYVWEVSGAGYATQRGELTVLDAQVTERVQLAAQDVKLHYTAGDNGRIVGEMEQRVAMGSDGQGVCAVADTGYRFVKWSDNGSDNPNRRELGVTSAVEAKAEFEKVRHTLRYGASRGGDVSSNEVEVEDGADGPQVTATALSPYGYFAWWSDGEKEATRTEKEVRQDKEVTARFGAEVDLPYREDFERCAGVPFGLLPLDASLGGAAWEVRRDEYVDGFGGDAYLGISSEFGNVNSELYSPRFRLDKSEGPITVTFTAAHVAPFIWRSSNANVHYTIDGVNWELLAELESAGRSESAKGYEYILERSDLQGAKFLQIRWTYKAAWEEIFGIDDLEVKAENYNGAVQLLYLAEGQGTVNGKSVEVFTTKAGEKGAEVRAEAAAGYTFLGWSDGEKDNVRQDEQATLVTAIFAPNPTTYYELTYTAGEHGSVQGPLCQKVAQGGEGMEVVAVPDEGYQFVSWDDGKVDNPRKDLDVSGPLRCVASFSNKAKVTYSVLPVAGGSITGKAEQEVTIGADGTKVTAVPALGWSFIGWSDGVLTAERAEEDVQSDTEIVANFAQQGDLIYVAGVGGLVRGEAKQHVALDTEGSEVMAVPLEGYEFVKWNEDGKEEAKRTDKGTEMPQRFTSEFKQQKFKLSYTASSGGSLLGAMDQEVVYGESGAEVTAVPAAGYRFVGWSDGEVENPRYDRNVYSTLTVEANFSKEVRLEYVAGTGGSVLGESPQKINYGSDGTEVKAEPEAGYHFVRWSDGKTENPRRDIGVKDDLKVTAEFSNRWLVVYKASKGGTIDGQLEQYVEHDGAGTAVTAKANSGWEFVGWSDMTEGTQHTAKNVTEEKLFVATFKPIEHTLTVEVKEMLHPQIQNLIILNKQGVLWPIFRKLQIVTIEGADQRVQHGELAQRLEAKLAPGVEFVQWSDGVKENPRYVLMDKDTRLEAEVRFVSIPIYLEVAGEWGDRLVVYDAQNPTHLFPEGRVQFEGDIASIIGVNWNRDERATQQRVQLEVEGMEKLGFSISGQPNERWYSPTGDLGYGILRVAIVPYTFTIRYAAGDGGMIVGRTEQEVASGNSSEEVEAVAREGYRFVQWNDGKKEPKRSELSVLESKEYVAEFEKIANDEYFIVSYTAQEGGVIAGDASQRIAAGGAGSEVEAVAREGYRFVQWNDGKKEPKRSELRVLESKEYVAEFEKIANDEYFTVSYTAQEGGVIAGDASQRIAAGGTGSEVEAVAREGYRFVQWNDGKKEPKRSELNVLESKEYVAEFEKLRETPVESLQLANVRLLVNPFTDCMVLLEMEEAQHVEVYSIAGVKLYDRPAKGAAVEELSTERWPHGVYIIRVIARDGEKILRGVKR